MGSAIIFSTGWGLGVFAMHGDAESITFYSLTEIVSAGMILFVSATLLGPLAGLVAAVAGGIAVYAPMGFSGSTDLQSTLPYSILAWSIASAFAIMLGVLSSGFARAIVSEAEQARNDRDRALLAKADLERALGENEALLQEVHHRVKNNLQIMASVIDLQADYSDNAKIRTALAVTRRRVEAMAFAHDTIYSSESLGKFDLAAFIVRLCGDTAASFPERLPKTRFSYELSEESSNLSTAVSCALAVSELVSNAVQHAPEDAPILINVGLGREGDELVVSISDDGPGIPEGAELGDGSLGLKLVGNLAAGLGGTFSIAEDRHRVAFRFPSRC
jgi:two-component sensor histidine kinase